MTPEQIEEHNRVFETAMQLVKGEIVLQECRFTSSCSPSLRLKLERAIQLFTRALGISPSNWSAMWFIGKIHQRLGDDSTALTWFDRAHTINASQADVAREASICAMTLGLSEKAIFYARSALRSRPYDNGLQANLALAFLLAGKLDDAKVIIEEATANDPMDPISKTIRTMVIHFIDSGKKPPSSTVALEDYWKRVK